MDFGASTSSSTSNPGTVSPHDLLVRDAFMPTPNSAAFTTLTSPSIFDGSPDFDGFDVSPNFGSAEAHGPADPWFPLFPPHVSPVVPVSMTPTVTPEDSPEISSEECYATKLGSCSPDPACGAGLRKKSTTSSHTEGRHSSVAGVNSRKRDKPLPPIVVADPNDTVAMKRARNTLAARKSRERKALRTDELEKANAELRAERDYWKAQAMSLAQAAGNPTEE